MDTYYVLETRDKPLLTKRLSESKKHGTRKSLAAIMIWKYNESRTNKQHTKHVAYFQKHPACIKFNVRVCLSCLRNVSIWKRRDVVG